MNEIDHRLEMITRQLSVDTAVLNTMAAKFTVALESGLKGDQSSLKMLPSYLATPTGDETGSFLALDFGGTNVRALRLNLLGRGQYVLQEQLSRPLRDTEGEYDYLSSNTTASQLFDFIAQQIATILPVACENCIYPLGHTFSFPCLQENVNKAVLMHWTKEIQTMGAVGEEITGLLNAALSRQHLSQIVPKAVINDTVGTLLTAAYGNTTTDIGSICGTGHNTCYLEKSSPLTGKPMIINLESGNFDQVPQADVDKLVDAGSERPGEQLLEKMTAGRYIGEIFRVLVAGLVKDRLLFDGQMDRMDIPYSISGAEVALFINETSRWLAERYRIVECPANSWQALCRIAELVVARSARLVAASYRGILAHIDPDLAEQHTIAIDGSLYEKMPGYARHLQETLANLLGNKARQVKIQLSKDGSGIGAAIAAAIAKGG
ncbi:hexokinase [Lucifera butyrica]|uniref:Hexokinase n=1 Tax=Lucifera butyrica TaxID=1351585 RepID=A0A498R422_9FIRM|nr:hexokinase [Lucifera butyrica]VBB04923.1 hexokinase [Lucifera butyrica]